MNPLGNVSPLIGRTCRTSTGNSALMKPLGLAGVIAGWKNAPSPVDIAEMEKWAAEVLGGDPVITNHMAGRRSQGAEAKSELAYEQWEKDHKR